MKNFHDPIKHLKFLRQSLSQDKKPLGFFISAGCPLSVEMPTKEQWPLIADVAGLTRFLKEELCSKTDDMNCFDNLLTEVGLSGKSVENVEDILSFIRSLIEVSVGNTVRGFSKAELLKLETDICIKIVGKLNVNLPDNESAYHKLASWIQIDREKPVEVFTTNYDLLIEQAFEDMEIPYFDGFVGSRQSFFDLRAVEDGLIPKHWTRLWKIHGSINWFKNDNKQVFRSSRIEETGASHLIYPSHLKYEESRKMPYLALIDRLNSFLRLPNSLMIMSGYSFNDEHLNDTIISALKSNPNTMVIALLFGTLDNYPKAISMAKKRSNLAIWAYDEAIIGTARGKWKTIPGSLEQEPNLIDFIIKKNKDEEPIDDQVQLGDFQKFGNFLQALIEYNQTKPDEK